MGRPWGGRRIRGLRALVIVAYGSTCWLCGKAIVEGQRWDIDHVMPRSQGGTDDMRNLRPAHARCNRSRGAKPVIWPL
jgi:5-methylcytosine-specific restriction endonuclease McrA